MWQTAMCQKRSDLSTVLGRFLVLAKRSILSTTAVKNCLEWIGKLKTYVRMSLATMRLTLPKAVLLSFATRCKVPILAQVSVLLRTKAKWTRVMWRCIRMTLRGKTWASTLMNASYELVLAGVLLGWLWFSGLFLWLLCLCFRTSITCQRRLASWAGSNRFQMFPLV